MKNHFILSYYGNKREEVEFIVKNLSFENITTIVEPYCGSSAMSVYIHMLYPKKFKYVLNDNNQILIELYKLMKQETKFKNFIDEINKLCFDEEDNFINKERYLELIKQKNLIGWFIKNKFYSITVGLYPKLRRPKKISFNEINNTPIIDFLRNEDILIYNEDALKIILENNIPETIILCDPPYLSVCNKYYSNAECSIYEWFFNNPKILKNTYFILESIYHIKILFRDYHLIEYDKTYNGVKKKKVKHTIIKIQNN